MVQVPASHYLWSHDPAETLPGLLEQDAVVQDTGRVDDPAQRG